MKYLNLYENKWNENSFKKFIDKKEKLYGLVKNFLIEEEYVLEKAYITDVYFANDGDKRFLVVRVENNKADDTILITDLENLYRYINDPELYIKTQKYNL